MERFRKAAVLLLAILIILSSCATTEGESYPSVSGTIVSISKYGNAMTSITSEEMKAAGYQAGDLIAITVGDYSAIVPLGTNYSDVDRSSAVAVDDGNAIELAINYGDFSSVSGCSEGTAVTVSMAEKGGYSEEFMIRHLVRTENRDDYASDAIFANFREVTVGNIKSGVLYRSCSPVRGDARAPYADALMGEAGIKTGIITSEDTKVVENRAKKLKVDFLYQGKRNGGKLAVAKEICEQLGFTLNEVAYIGDDVNCVELLEAVGMKACPADACEEVKAIAGIHVMTKKGGEGCVREFSEICLN